MMFDPKSLMSDCNPRLGKILTGSALYRGAQVSGAAVDQELSKLGDKYSSNFVEWIPNRMMSSICSVNSAAHRLNSMSGSILLNTTSINSTFKRVNDTFDLMFKKKAYVHWYTAEGMELYEFEEAQSNLADLISEYQ